MFDFWAKSAMLGMEASRVIWLRSFVLAGGGARAQREMNLMVAEKFAAAWQSQMQLLGGQGTEKALATYRKAVRRNVRRLTR